MTLTQEDISAITSAVGDALEPRFKAIDLRFDRVEVRIGNIETRLDKVEVRLGNVETRLDKVEVRLGNVEVSLQKAHDRLGRIEVFVPVENAYKLHDLDERLKKIMDRPVS